jgi:hypothetical protein
MVSFLRMSSRAPPLRRRLNACPRSFADLVDGGHCVLSSFCSQCGLRSVPRPGLRCAGVVSAGRRLLPRRFPLSGVNGHHPCCLFTRVITAGLLARDDPGSRVCNSNCAASQIRGSSEDQEQKTEDSQRHSGVSIPNVRTHGLEIDRPMRVGAEPQARMAPACLRLIDGEHAWPRLDTNTNSARNTRRICCLRMDLIAPRGPVEHSLCPWRNKLRWSRCCPLRLGSAITICARGVPCLHPAADFTRTREADA